MPTICGGKSSSTEDKSNKEIDKKIKKDKKTFMMTHRIPVVGAGESGKSTLIKQMQILYINGFSNEERKSKVKDIRGNVKDGMLAVTSAMKTLVPPVDLEHSENQTLIDFIQQNAIKPDFEYTKEFFEYCHTLWKDSGVQATFARANEYQLIDSTKYFLDQVTTVAKDDYLPTDQDLLRCRVLTSGIYETKFTMNKICFHMFDVGGQREERRKWIQVFSDVTAVIFVCACSGYDMTLREAQRQNRLRESISLFSEVWANRYLRQTSMILFLNKQDLFIQKLTAGKTRLVDYFPEFADYESSCKLDSHSPDEPPEVTKAKYFVKDKFMVETTKQVEGSRRCYPHFTCAVDTENIKRVFGDCQDMLQRIYMQKMGLM